MAGDPHNAYRAGCITASLMTAEAALESASGAAFVLVALDHPLTAAIAAALEQIRAARSAASSVSSDAMRLNTERFDAAADRARP